MVHKIFVKICKQFSLSEGISNHHKCWTDGLKERASWVRKCYFRDGYKQILVFTYVALPLLVLGFLGDDEGVPGRRAADPGVDSSEEECVLILT